MGRRLRAVIFDMAGTVLDFGSMAPAMVYVETFRREGVEISLEEARAPMGVHKRMHVQEIVYNKESVGDTDPVFERWITIKGSEPTEEDVERMFGFVEPALLKCLHKYSDLIPGTLETMNFLRQEKILVGSATGYMGEMMKINIEKGEEQGYFPLVAVSASGLVALFNHQGTYGFHSETIVGRPDPSMPLVCARYLNDFLPEEERFKEMIPPELCLVVDDTTPGITSGKNAGMLTAGVINTGSEMGLSLDEYLVKKEEDPRYISLKVDLAKKKMLEAGADFVVGGIEDIPSVVTAFNNNQS